MFQMLKMSCFTLGLLINSIILQIYLYDDIKRSCYNCEQNYVCDVYMIYFWYLLNEMSNRKVPLLYIEFFLVFTYTLADKTNIEIKLHLYSYANTKYKRIKRLYVQQHFQVNVYFDFTCITLKL